MVNRQLCQGGLGAGGAGTPQAQSITPGPDSIKHRARQITELYRWPLPEGSKNIIPLVNAADKNVCLKSIAHFRLLKTAVFSIFGYTLLKEPHCALYHSLFSLSILNNQGCYPFGFGVNPWPKRRLIISWWAGEKVIWWGINPQIRCRHEWN